MITSNLTAKNNLFIQILAIAVKRKQVQAFNSSIKWILLGVLALYLVQNKVSAIYVSFTYIIFHRIQFLSFLKPMKCCIISIKGTAESSHHLKYCSQYSAQTTDWGIVVRFLVGEKIFLFSQDAGLVLEHSQPPIQWVLWDSFPGKVDRAWSWPLTSA